MEELIEFEDRAYEKDFPSLYKEVEQLSFNQNFIEDSAFDIFKVPGRPEKSTNIFQKIAEHLKLAV